MPGFGRLARQAHYQVDGYVAEAGIGGIGNSLAGLLRTVDTIEQVQFRVVKRLYSNAQPIEEVHIGQVGQVLGRQVFGVGFERDLFELRQVIVFAYRLHNPCQLPGRQNRGRAATEVDGFQRLVSLPRHQFAAQGIDIRLRIAAAGYRIKAAIRAFVVAIWDVDVEQRTIGLSQKKSGFAFAKPLGLVAGTRIELVTSGL